MDFAVVTAGELPISGRQLISMPHFEHMNVWPRQVAFQVPLLDDIETSYSETVISDSGQPILPAVAVLCCSCQPDRAQPVNRTGATTKASQFIRAA